jgi:2-octaprenylphenol hydroxylase
MSGVSSVAGEFDRDIVIIGGGMVGLSVALLVASSQPQRTISVIEQHPWPSAEQSFQPSFDARNTALAHGSRALLEAMGVWQSLSAHVTEVASVHISDKGHVGGCKIHKGEHQVPALGYVTDNHWLGRCLYEQASKAPQIELIGPAQVSATRAVRGGYRISIDRASSRPGPVENRSEVSARLLVVAGGAMAETAKALGVRFSQSAYGQTGLVANVAFSQPHLGVAYERFTAAGPIAILPRGESAGARQGGLIWTLPEDQVAAACDASDEDLLARLQSQFGDRLGHFQRIGERHFYPLKLTRAQEQIRPHLVLLGNTAHSLHPVAGQGFNLSLRDAASLAKALTTSQPLGSLAQLQTYLHNQAEDQWLTTHFSDQLPKLFSSSDLAKMALRGLGLLGLELLPPAKQRLAAQSMGARGSVLAAH